MADALGEYWYFEEGADPSKSTIPQLRSILLKHNVRYPASAKKAVLVDLFNEHVLPQAAQIQRTHARTKRSTRGIEDVPSSTASTTTDDPEDETMLAPPPAMKRTSRRTTRAATEEETGRPVPAPRGKTPSRTVPTKHAREPDADADADGGQPAMRRSRKSVPPVVNEPPPDPEAWHRPAADSPFTQENPFQSGSSPLGPDAKTGDRRRKSMGFEHKEKRKSDANRRRTFQPKTEQQDDGVVVPSRKTFHAPVLRSKREEVAAMPDAADVGEDFTPEEQLELVRERAKNGEVDILPPRRRKQSSKAAGTIKAFSLTLLTTALAVFGGVWRQEKYAVGFCGVGQDSTSLAGVDIPEFANALLPRCEPCPPHAICYKNLEVQCDKDFVKKEHPLALGGLVPLPPTCEADTEKTRKVTMVANRAVQILRKRRAQYECGEPDAEGNIVQNADVSVEDIKRDIFAQKVKSMSNEEFEDLFARAIGETKLREEVVESTEGTERRLASTSFAELSLLCSIRRSLRESLERHLLTIIIVFLATASGFYGKYSITTNRAMEARAKQLASDVFDRLANQATLAHHEPGAYQERGLSMNQLRDDVLRNEFSSSRRMKLWQRVQKKVEHNSNIRAAVREGQSGDITRMWEWIGPVQMLEDGRSSGKRESGRYSLGWAPNSSPPEPQAMKEVRQWDEGHPIY
ncbi:sister chromatid separation protein-like protein [Lentithecium fluviatile CBS 122367]|uniref:Sister chromatid separation protein-like protein n=1 Tax=Lentithecium fluviatile CBS 122367 TaxID=1168545 RepID=A0A6G1IFE1_9PLEO|nr:sister chromatid separation protein-like protein [Lentithecium fluviatile CBS 122367]